VGLQTGDTDPRSASGMNLAAIDISDHHAPTVSILIGNCVPNRGFVQQVCVSAAVSLFAQSHLPRNLGAGHRLADRWSAFGIRVVGLTTSADVTPGRGGGAWAAVQSVVVHLAIR
jgi:hypothetical protein